MKMFRKRQIISYNQWNKNKKHKRNVSLWKGSMVYGVDTLDLDLIKTSFYDN